MHQRSVPRASNPQTTSQSPSDQGGDYGPLLNLTVWALVGVASVFLGLRIFCKCLRRLHLWWDDYILIAGWLTIAISAALQSVCASLGLGRQTHDTTQKSFNDLLFYSYLAGFFSILSAALTKTSFAVTLLRISHGWVYWFVWFIIVSVNLVIGANATIQWVQCWPTEVLWQPVSGGGRCWPRSVVKNYNTFVSVYSGSMDIILALLPWRIIWNAMISNKEKLGALVAMSMGIFAGITSLLKVTTLYAIGDPNMSTVVYLFIVGTAESAITIIAASIPILRALLHQDTRPRPASFIRL